jgi:hypothetical protein
MFVEAIETVSGFTRPLHSIIRLKDNKIIPGSATLFFVNENGFAVTCKHVAETIGLSEAINRKYTEFRQEVNSLSSIDRKEDLFNRYGYMDGAALQLKNSFVDCVDRFSELNIIMHKHADLAIVQFIGFNQIRYRGHAIFLKNGAEIRQGKFLCRLGYPFPEFNNFSYDSERDDITWIQSGNPVSPRFPIEGMVTRHLAGPNGIYGIELSTPGLRGQSGGPLFDEKGRVYGMQSSTSHLHLGFDLEEKEVLVNNISKRVSNHAFLHLGQCLHSDLIKNFLAENNVEFYED